MVCPLFMASSTLVYVGYFTGSICAFACESIKNEIEKKSFFIQIKNYRQYIITGSYVNINNLFFKQFYRLLESSFRFDV